MEEMLIPVGIEVDIKKPENFLKIKETLTRIGIASKNKLYQSCHILHKRNKEGISKYFILHFKELFILDGKIANFNEYDIPKRNKIIKYLEEWKLLKIIDINNLNNNNRKLVNVGYSIIPWEDKSKWELISKFTMGKKK